MTEYLTSRAQQLVQQAQERIDIVDYLIPHLFTAQAKAAGMARAAGLAAMLMAMRDELQQEKDTAMRIIEEATAIRNHTQEVNHGRS